MVLLWKPRKSWTGKRWQWPLAHRSWGELLKWLDLRRLPVPMITSANCETDGDCTRSRRKVSLNFRSLSSSANSMLFWTWSASPWTPQVEREHVHFSCEKSNLIFIRHTYWWRACYKPSLAGCSPRSSAPGPYAGRTSHPHGTTHSSLSWKVGSHCPATLLLKLAHHLQNLSKSDSRGCFRPPASAPPKEGSGNLSCLTSVLGILLIGQVCWPQFFGNSFSLLWVWAQ